MTIFYKDNMLNVLGTESKLLVLGRSKSVDILHIVSVTY